MKKKRGGIEGLEAEGDTGRDSPRILGNVGVEIFSVQLAVSSPQMQNAFWFYI